MNQRIPPALIALLILAYTAATVAMTVWMLTC